MWQLFFDIGGHNFSQIPENLSHSIIRWMIFEILIFQILENLVQTSFILKILNSVGFRNIQFENQGNEMFETCKIVEILKVFGIHVIC